MFGKKLFLVSTAWIILSLMNLASESTTINIIAHRGNSSESPENTLVSFIEAIEMGVDFIELDIQLTKDKVPVVLHDPVLQRTTDNAAPLLVNELTLEELKKFDAGSWFDINFLGEKIPTLEEVLNLPLKQTGLMIDIKDESSDEYEIAEAIVNAILNAETSYPVFVGSTNPAILTFFKQLHPNSPIIAIIYESDVVEWHEMNRPDIYAYDKAMITKTLIQNIHKKGKRIWAWTVDDDLEIEEFSELGVDGIITNRPRAALLMKQKVP